MRINVPVAVAYVVGLLFLLACWWLIYRTALYILSMAALMQAIG